MTPIFKRYFKKEAFLTLFCMLFLLAVFFTKIHSAEEWIYAVRSVVTENGITADTFRTKEGRELAENVFSPEKGTEYYNERYMKIYDKISYSFEHNKYGVYVPRIYIAVDSAADETLGIVLLTGIVSAVVFSVGVFIAERRKKTIDFVGMLPYKRPVMFTDKWLAGLLCLTLFFAANFALSSLWLLKTLPVCADLGARLAYGADFGKGMIAAYAGRYMVYAMFSIAFYSFMMFAQTLFGKPSYAAALAAFAACFLPLALKGADDFCYTYGLDGINGIMRTVLDITSDRFLLCAIFAAAALVFFAAGLICDKAARLERAGGIFMFAPVKWLVYLFFMFISAFAFYLFAVDMCAFDSGTLLNGIVLLLVGAGVSALVLTKLIKEV